MLAEGDPLALALFAKYKTVRMPNLGLNARRWMRSSRISSSEVELRWSRRTRGSRRWQRATEAPPVCRCAFLSSALRADCFRAAPLLPETTTCARPAPWKRRRKERQE